jgi:signal transduction histidine kinase
MFSQDSIKTSYASALAEYLSGGGEDALGKAYEIGRHALECGMGVLDMAQLHHEALSGIPSHQDARALEAVQAAQRFLLDTLAVFEMALRSFRESNLVLRHFNETLEEEIKRIAHVLHSHTGQLLAAIHLEFGRMEGSTTERINERLARVRGLLGQVEQQMRRLTHEIRPPVLDDLGLLPALEFLRDGLEQRSTLSITVDGPRDQRYPQSVEITVFRVVQEALTNVVKHASASEVSITVTNDNGRLVCSVRDDGVGFDVAAQASGQGARGLGLLAMKQRVAPLGGDCEIISSVGQGTEIRLSIPLEQ